MKVRLFFILILGLAACSPSNNSTKVPSPVSSTMTVFRETTANTPTTPVTATSSETQTRIPTEPPSITEKPSKTTLPTEYPLLNPKGPYILSDYILLNSDGSGMKPISYPREYSLVNYSPDGEWGVLFNGGYYDERLIDPSGWEEMSISLLHVPDGTISKISLILTNKVLTEKHVSAECGYQLDVILDNVVWSPDGRYLAFIADPSGTSFDLFTYDTDLKILRRLTNDDADVISISWSTDGTKLFYINGSQLDRFGTYAIYTLNMTSPENGPNQGIQTFYSGNQKITIEWMDQGEGLIYSRARDHSCVEGGELPPEPAEISYLNISSGEKSIIRTGLNLAVKAIDPVNRAMLIDVDSGDGQIIDFKGKTIATPAGISCWSAWYLGDQENNFLCMSTDLQRIVGLSYGGKVNEIATLSDGILYSRVSPVSSDKKWFVISSSSGIYLYKNSGELFLNWSHAIGTVQDFPEVLFLWAPDGKGLYFAIDGRQLYYWSFLDPSPKLIFDGQPQIGYLFRYLIWVK